MEILKLMWFFKNTLSCLKTKKTYYNKERRTLEQLIQFPDMSQSYSFVYRYFYFYIFLPISEPLTFLDRVPLSVSLSLSLSQFFALSSHPIGFTSSHVFVWRATRSRATPKSCSVKFFHIQHCSNNITFKINSNH